MKTVIGEALRQFVITEPTLRVVSFTPLPSNNMYASRGPIFKVYITSVGILNVCNLWILLRKIAIYLVVFMDFLAVKVDGSDVKSGISLTKMLHL